MLARILQPSLQLCAFLDPLIESLSKPQRAHLQQLCDGVLVCKTEHTLAAMQRLLVDTTDPSNWADPPSASVPGKQTPCAPNYSNHRSNGPSNTDKKVVKLLKSTSTSTIRAGSEG